MIITKDLVILNLPKTGSSFVRKVMKEIYFKRRNKNILTKGLHKLKIKKIGFKEVMADHPTILNYKDQHGCFDQIPIEDKNKQILSVVRDPYLRLESVFKFRWWVDNPPIENEQIEKYFPDFPDLTLQQFIQMHKLVNENLKMKYGIDNKLKMGNQSIQFIRMFFRNHKEIFESLTEDYFSKGYFQKDLCDVTFLKNENLNEELALFLSKYSFSNEEIMFVKYHKKVNVTKNEIDKTYITQDLIDYVNEYEQPLFEILSSIGINYNRN